MNFHSHVFHVFFWLDLVSFSVSYLAEKLSVWWCHGIKDFKEKNNHYLCLDIFPKLLELRQMLRSNCSLYEGMFKLLYVYPNPNPKPYLRVPINLDCESSYVYSWVGFITIELYCHLLGFEMYGIYSAKAKCRILQRYWKWKIMYVSFLWLRSTLKCNWFFHVAHDTPFHQVSWNSD